MVQILIIADDLTGSMDTGAQFVNAGVAAKVYLYSDEIVPIIRHCDAPVLVVNTESRHLLPEEAARRAKQVAAAAAQEKIPYLYKKTDSALRGNIGSELSAVLENYGTQDLFFIPAYPSMERYTIGGCQYVGDKPLHLSSFANDPFHPIRRSQIAQIIAEQSNIPSKSLTLSQLSAYQPSGNRQIIIVDGSTNSDLDQIGHMLAQSDRLHLLAGCAGFASVLPQLLNLPQTVQPFPAANPHRLLISGSLHPNARQQRAKAVDTGYVSVPLTEDLLLQPESVLHCIPENWTKVMLCTAGDSGRLLGDPSDLEQDAARVALGFGHCTHAIYEKVPSTALIVFGGDTLSGVVQCLEGDYFSPLCEIAPGVIFSLLSCKYGHIPIVSKAGAFGKDSIIVDIDQFLDQLS